MVEGVSQTPVHFDPKIRLSRIAPGCPCCVGKLTMQVTLNRLLRDAPARMYIAMADAAHIEGMRAFLTQAPYDALLKLDDDLLL